MPVNPLVHNLSEDMCKRESRLRNWIPVYKKSSQNKPVQYDKRAMKQLGVSFLVRSAILPF